jgi:hypothetical protein
LYLLSSFSYSFPGTMILHVSDGMHALKK